MFLILDFLSSACYVGEKVIAIPELKESEILLCYQPAAAFSADST